jgi:hypothetical protein
MVPADLGYGGYGDAAVMGFGGYGCGGYEMRRLWDAAVMGMRRLWDLVVMGGIAEPKFPLFPLTSAYEAVSGRGPSAITAHSRTKPSKTAQ